MMKLLWFFNLSGNAVQFIKNDLKFNKVYSCFPYKAILYYELTVKYPAHLCFFMSYEYIRKFSVNGFEIQLPLVMYPKK